jgi:hypothetical protein
MNRGFPKVCDINNNVIQNGLDASTGCTSGGNGFLCQDYSPVATSDSMSYGFGIMSSTGNCCKCYQLTWSSGNANGKSMVVQIINSFSPSGDVGANDIILLTPGGGVGPNNAGCRYQYGTSW